MKITRHQVRAVWWILKNIEAKLVLLQLSVIVLKDDAAGQPTTLFVLNGASKLVSV